MNFVFVCTGNICRSSMAEAIAQSMVRDTKGLTFSSLGTGALVGQSADAYAIAVCEEIGVDLSSHKARQLDTKELMDAELIFCMDRGHLQFVSALSPVLADKTVLLTDYPKKRLFSKDVKDPFRSSKGYFRKIRDQIRKELERIIPLLEQL